MSALGAKLRVLEGGNLAFRCPGCKRTHHLPIRQPGGVHGWDFNGNADRPTFHPSILARSETWHPPVTPENLAEWKANPWPQTKHEEICHSFVIGGRIQFLSDCTHELVGQTVDLPDWDLP